MDLGLERPDGVPVLLTHVILDVLAEDDDRVVVLLHPARWALDARLEPGRDAFRMENVLALELLIVPFGELKTDGTCVRKVCKTLPVLDRRSFALGPRKSH